MATYYRWRQSQVAHTDVVKSSGYISSGFSNSAQYYTATSVTINNDAGIFEYSGLQSHTAIEGGTTYPQGTILFGYKTNSTFDLGKESYYLATGTATVRLSSSDGLAKLNINGESHELQTNPGTLVGYVYSTNASAYPNGGVQGNYYYDQRTTITSPAAPTNLQYPNPITTPTVTVSWDATTSNVPGVTIDHYYVFPYVNNIPFGPAGVIVPASSTSVEMQIPTTYNGSPVTSIQFGISAYDSNNNSSSQPVGPWVPVHLAPTLTAPSLAMQNQPITVTWTAIAGATGYTLQRKADTDADWVQVYSGPNLTFTETAGAWSSVQYRVQAIFSAGTGGWATSESIPVMSASALVISGQDGDLGTLVNDVPYTISTDTGNPISVRTTVNGAVIFAGEVESGVAKVIPVLDLVNGEGTIVIEASVETSSGTVSAARAWTYDKDLITFPNGGSPAQMTKEGKIVFPKTLAECVRLPGGRTLDKIMGFPAQIYVERYTGTGTYGSSDPNELAIPFKPQAVFVTSGNTGTTILMVRPGTVAINGSAALTVAWENDGVTWYSTSAANQMNAAEAIYDVVAFG